MFNVTGFRKLVAAGALSALVIMSVSCSRGGDPAATPTAGAAPTAAVNMPTATSIQPTTQLPVSNLVSDLSSTEIIKAQESVLIDLFKKTANSVVRIQTRTRAGGAEGSGWVWDTEGHIITNYHVVDGATQIEVFFYDGHEYEGTVVGFNTDADMAVVKIDPGDYKLQPAALGSSSTLQVGQMTIALGNPFGNDFSMTTGIVSAIGRLIPSGFTLFSIPSVIQTDAAINPGNSGGPLLDVDGRVIGMNTQINSDSGSSSGVGFAVPVDLVKRVVPSLIQDGEHVYSFIGISGIAINRLWREGLSLPNGQQGAYITEVRIGTPAERAGLKAESGTYSRTGDPVNANFDGDLIVSIDGRPVKSMDDLIAYLALNTAPGDDIVLGVLRGGRETPVVVTLTQRSQ